MLLMNKLLIVILAMLPMLVHAGDLYVISATHKNQSEAQKTAAIKGGWVLNTNFYPELTPNLFAVVRGPYKDRREAKEVLEFISEDGSHPNSYIKDAGDINIKLEIGNKSLSPQMLAALLGEIRIDISEYPGGSEPCEPGESYKQASLAYVTITQHYDENKDIVFYTWGNVGLDVGAFREINRTGEIERMRICSE